MLRGIATYDDTPKAICLRAASRLLVVCGWLSIASAMLFASAAEAQSISRYTRLTGNLNYTATGGSLRTQDNNGDACAVGSSSSQSLTGIPAGATIRAAYLYWAGSGGTADNAVTLNGFPITASRTFSETYNNGGTLLPFFGAFADVTSFISGNGTVTFGGLAVNTGSPHCGVAAVLAGWSLIVVYERSVEPLRAINIFDGLQYFRGSSLTLTPDGFRIPTSGIDGKITVVTWEGDPGNSTALNGFSESLSFNGTQLDDGINVPGSDPLIQQYDGTVNTLGVSTSYGVDVDTYDVSGLLSPGQTTASTDYSAGGDLVLLAAQIVSVTSEPLVDMSLTKSHTGNFTVGTNATFTLTVSNASGLQSVDYPITVTDTLPAGLSYVSGVGTGWTCGAVGQTVTCTHAAPLASGASLPAITLTVTVGNAAYPSVTNAATVSSPGTNDVNSANNTASDTVTVVGPNLSTSTKAVVDLNGGDANPGDTLRYTITLQESAGIAASGVSVTDDIPGNVSGFTVLSAPSGATNTSTGSGTGANNTGYLSISNISVPANGSATVVFDVQVAASVSPGATIDNTAIVNNPAGAGATPSAPQIVVSASQIAGSGTKQLYMYGASAGSPAYPMSRTAPGTTPGAVTIGNNNNVTWRLSSPLRKAVTLQAGSHAVQLWLSRNNSGFTRSISVTLGYASSLNGTPTPIAAANVTYSFFNPLGTAPSLESISLPIGSSPLTIPAGSYFTLDVENTTGTNNRDVIVSFASGTNDSRIELNSASVINVDTVATYDATYPGGAATASFNRGATAYIRAVVSDPFGSFDISGATITLLDANGATQINAQTMTQVADSGAATKTYQYTYAIPSNAAAGNWTVRVTANEGVEGVTDLGVGVFTVTVPLPTLQVTKISQVLSDPVNGSTNPKSIPNSIQRYTVTVTNSGPGIVDASSLVITDAVPGNTRLYVATGGGDPIEFIDGTTPSGLSYNYATHVTYSNQVGGGAPYNYTPTPDANGFDSAVTGVRIAPSGSMAAASGGNQPSFAVRFRVQVR